MVAADAVVILVGQVLGRRRPVRAIRIGATGVFILSVLLTLAETLG